MKNETKQRATRKKASQSQETTPKVSQQQASTQEATEEQELINPIGIKLSTNTTTDSETNGLAVWQI